MNDFGAASLQADRICAKEAKRKRRPNGDGHKGKKVHICECIMTNGIKCGKTYTRAEHLRRHRLGHSSPVYICPMHNCGIQFYRRDLARNHMKHHPCEQDFSSRISPDTHWPLSMSHYKRKIYSHSYALKQFQELATGKSHNSGTEAELCTIRHYIESFRKLYLPSTNRNQMLSSHTWWEEAVPIVSISDSILSDVVLSLSSAHLAWLNVNEGMLKLSVGYQTRAISRYRKLVHDLEFNVRPSNSEGIESMLLVSYFLCIRAFISTEQSNIQNSNMSHCILDSEYELSNILTWLNLCRGFTIITTNLKPFAHSTVFWRITQPPTTVDTDTNSATEDAHVDQSRTSYFARFNARVLAATQSSRLREAYSAMLHLIEAAYKELDRRWPQKAFIEAWRDVAFGMPQHMLQAIHAQAPGALAILAHFICLEKAPSFESVWWVSGQIRPKIYALASMVPADWAWAMEWPIRVAEEATSISSLMPEPGPCPEAIS